jgi:hypothetical protein
MTNIRKAKERNSREPAENPNVIGKDLPKYQRKGAKEEKLARSSKSRRSR